MAGVNPPGGGHPEIGPELRRLAQAVLDRLDPALRAAAAGSGGPPGRCQQVWCPVCALGALVTGEQHPLLSVIAEHSVALMTVIRAMTTESAGGSANDSAGPANDSGRPAPEDGTGDGGAGEGAGEGASADAEPANGAASGRYQKIPIVVQAEAERVGPDPSED